MRIGYGWDSHEFQAGVPLKIGGVELPHPKGLAGHSDGDVLLHAITDALLGAVAAGDIGSYFPPTDPRWKGADSVIFLEEALKQVRLAGYKVSNVDSTLILAEPKIVPHAKKIQARVADSNLDPNTWKFEWQADPSGAWQAAALHAILRCRPELAPGSQCHPTPISFAEP